MHRSSTREKKTDIVRKRTGCHNCRSRRRKCDEARPECQACVQRGTACGGYNRPFTFKDVSERTAASSRRFEAARWAALQRDEVPKVQQKGPSEEAIGSADAPQVSPGACSPKIASNLGATTILVDDDQQAYPPLDDARSDWILLNQTNICSQDAGLLYFSAELEEPWHQLDDEAVGFSQSTPEFDFATPDACNDVDGASTNGFLQTLENDGVAQQAQVQVPLTNFQSSISTSDGTADSPSVDSSTSSRSGNSLLGDPAADCGTTHSIEVLLVRNFEQFVVPSFPVNISFPRSFYESPSFRAAVLALSASHLRTTRTSSHGQLPNKGPEKRDWFYYDQAVKHVSQQLKQSQSQGDESLVGATLLLAYHELDVGSPLGARNHVRGLDAIASNLRLANSSMPGLFKAWRILRQDIKCFSISTRKSGYPSDPYEVYNALDPQLAVREILGDLWKLHERHAIESTFITDNPRGTQSASQKANEWFRSIFHRKCDEQQSRDGDYHTTNISSHKILDDCELYSQKLDQWHSGLDSIDLPVPQLGSAESFVSGPSFETFMTYKFSGARKAINYVIYCVSRMLCNYLRSAIDGSTLASVSETWGRLILGIIYHVDIRSQRFSLFRFDNLLLMTALLSEGGNIAMTIQDGLIPRMSQHRAASSGLVNLTYLKGWLKLAMDERLRGKAIRYMISEFDENDEHWQGPRTHKVAAFGDYNGKGSFRQCYMLDCTS